MAVFSVDVTFVCHFMAPPAPYPLTYRSASGIGYASKKYLKWQAIQLATHSIVGE